MKENVNIEERQLRECNSKTNYMRETKMIDKQKIIDILENFPKKLENIYSGYISTIRMYEYNITSLIKGINDGNFDVYKITEEDAIFFENFKAINNSIKKNESRIKELENQVCYLIEKESVDDTLSVISSSRIRESFLSVCESISETECVCGYHVPRKPQSDNIEEKKEITDTERLDFIEKNHISIHNIRAKINNNENGNASWCSSGNSESALPCSSIRDAIDILINEKDHG